ncbi:MAG: radical SAM family heme chaperone HemW [Myxococcales bacterium]|nr:radical SAM family heme chaperone HemW [Myxococcales bacterium]
MPRHLATRSAAEPTEPARPTPPSSATAQADSRADCGLYVHVPFCASKCPYCAFASEVRSDLMEAWAGAVLREAAAQAGRWGGFDTLYLGGGTPSLLPPRLLERLLSGLRRVFRFATDCETTLEANPGDVDRERIGAWRASGINRLSLGIQSFSDPELEFLGRRHDAQRARRALDLAREAGFRNLGLDLVYGWRGQDEDTLCGTLAEVVRFGPEHVSCYQLTIEEGTPFFIRNKSRPLLASEEEQANRFLLLSEVLGAGGFEHYEVSNFARGAHFRSRHNQKYWARVPTLGLGPAAHSFDGSRRAWNVRSLEGYLRSLGEGGTGREGEEALDERQARTERILLGLRTCDGVRLDVLSASAREKALSKFVPQLLLRVRAGRLCPTPRGMLLADRLALELCE